MTPDHWTPRIVAFFCNWCTYTAADLAGVSRLRYAPNVRVIHLMCSGRVDPQFILDALARGADGVLIGGCHPGDCRSRRGRAPQDAPPVPMLNASTTSASRTNASASNGSPPPRAKKWTVINEMTEQIRELGMLGMPKRFEDWDHEMENLESEAQAALAKTPHYEDEDAEVAPPAPTHALATK